MATLRSLENFSKISHLKIAFVVSHSDSKRNLFVYFVITAGVDMARLFNHVLLQQTQLEDSQGAITITNMYSTWSVLIFSLPCYQHVLFATSIGPKIKILPGSLMTNNAKKKRKKRKKTKTTKNKQTNHT